MAEQHLAANEPDLLAALDRSLGEEIDTLRALVENEDADCITRDLRAERLAAFEYVLRVVRRMETWEW